MTASVRRVLRSAIASITFLTGVPIARRIEVRSSDLRRGLVLFPVVGALVGVAAAATAWGAARVLPSPVAAVLCVAVWAVVTAGLHLDGLADVADGIGASLGGGEPRVAMADARLGAFGTTALVLDLLLKVLVVSALGAGGRFPAELVAAGAVARVAPIGLMWRLPYAGPPDGAGGWTDRIRGAVVAAGGLVGAGIAVLAVGTSVAGAMVVVAVAVCGSIGTWARARLGGTTGDVLGAAVEVTETVALTVALAVV